MAVVSVTLARASLFDTESENDFTLLEDHGEYFISTANRIGPYRQFVQTLFDDEDGLFQDLVTSDVQGNFLVLMEALSMRWGDKFRCEIIQDRDK